MTFTWNCDECGKPIANGDGYLHIDHLAAMKQRSERREETAAIHARYGFPVPLHAFTVRKAIPWQVHHRDCDPRPDSADHWTDVQRLRAWPDAIRTVCHFGAKVWAAETDLFAHGGLLASLPARAGGER